MASMFKQSRSAGVDPQESEDKDYSLEWQSEMCVCGCSKQWHSLTSDVYHPALSGCLFGSSCGCKYFRAAKEDQ